MNFVSFLKEKGIIADDLRLCTVKLADDLERRHCFEVVTPSRSCMLQADSDMDRRKWCMYLEAGIARALRVTSSNKVHYIYNVYIYNVYIHTCTFVCTFHGPVYVHLCTRGFLYHTYVLHVCMCACMYLKTV